MGSPLCTNSGTHLYPENTTLITAIEATGVQLKPEAYIEWSIALNVNMNHIKKKEDAQIWEKWDNFACFLLLFF